MEERRGSESWSFEGLFTAVSFGCGADGPICDRTKNKSSNNSPLKYCAARLFFNIDNNQKCFSSSILL